MRIALLAAALLFPVSASAAWAPRTAGGTTVHVYTPARPSGALIVALHGCTQGAEPIRDRGGWEDAAEAGGAVIAVPAVPRGGVLAGCWDYYGTAHTRTNHHNGAVLQIVDALTNDDALAVDARQVYVVGLSSGATQAAVLGCLAPEVFAGVGINAGPTVGTEASEIAVVSTRVAEAAAVCRRLAGGRAADLATQVASIIYGDGDFIVAKGYNRLNADVLGELFAAPDESTLDVAGMQGYLPAGLGWLRSDAMGPRISLIEVAGMGHAFPAGTGAGREISFVASQGPSWPAHLIDFFAAHNRRIPRAPTPDGGTPGVDAAGPSSDSGAPTDAGKQAPVDGGNDAGSGPQIVEAVGCDCRGARGDESVELILAALAPLFAVFRSRRRARARR